MVLAILSLLMGYRWQKDPRVFHTVWTTAVAFALIEVIYRRVARRIRLTKQETLSKYGVE